MAYQSFKKAVEQQLAEIRGAGLYKAERQILGPQGSEIRVAQGEVLNLCANNYLGLANHPDVVKAAAEGLRQHGYGMASVRFICGTQDLHKRLEQDLTTFLEQATPSCTAHVSMRTPVSSRPSLMSAMPLSVTRSTTPV